MNEAATYPIQAQSLSLSFHPDDDKLSGRACYFIVALKALEVRDPKE